MIEAFESCKRTLQQHDCYGAAINLLMHWDSNDCHGTQVVKNKVIKCIYIFVSLHAKRLTLSLRLQGGTQRTAPLDFKSPVLHSMDEWLASLFPNVL